jgi:hypothetical protein
LRFGLVHAFWLALANQLAAGAFRALLFAPGLALLASWFSTLGLATAVAFITIARDRTGARAQAPITARD